MMLKPRNLFSTGLVLVLCWGCDTDEADYREVPNEGLEAYDADEAAESWNLVAEAGHPGPKKDDCCVVQETPGCADEAIEACVCAVDPFCCQVAWDAICVAQVSSVCGVLCDPKDDHDDDDNDNGNDKKDDDKKDDDKKDDDKKDDHYDPDACLSGDCCVARDEPGCEVPEIEACVCSFDAFCCETAWDSICVGEAIQECGAKCKELPNDDLPPPV